MRQLKETISIFQGNPLFQGFAAEEIASLLASAPDPTRFARGEQLLSPGSTKRALGFLLEGSALVTRGGAGVAMSRLTPGAAFGMATLFASGEPFPNEIRAETACTALFLPQQWVAEMIGREARFAFNYIALLSERILFLNRRIDTFTAGDVPQRLRGMLDQFRRRLLYAACIAARRGPRVALPRAGAAGRRGAFHTGRACFPFCGRRFSNRRKIAGGFIR